MSYEPQPPSLLYPNAAAAEEALKDFALQNGFDLIIAERYHAAPATTAPASPFAASGAAQQNKNQQTLPPPAAALLRPLRRSRFSRRQ
ncbi:hypothetical protein MCOR02_012454 [Pyricularia oryzae]|nr:hypothetical protein MCOR02_012454 [Pyricularia oryzae]